MEAIVDRVLQAALAGRRVTVHGDFDVDGVCATAILVGALRGLGAECDWLIPDRLADGYGLDADNIRRLAERGTSLLVTVDCGITAVDEVALAKQLGIDVIVTDHHQPGPELPDCPILHPSLDGYPFIDLCGAAVAWKLASALRGASGGGSPGTPGASRPGDPPARRPPRFGSRRPGDGGRCGAVGGGEQVDRAKGVGGDSAGAAAGDAGAARGLLLRADPARRGGSRVQARAEDQRRRPPLSRRRRRRAVPDRGRREGGRDRGRARAGQTGSAAPPSARSRPRPRRRSATCPTISARRQPSSSRVRGGTPAWSGSSPRGWPSATTDRRS